MNENKVAKNNFHHREQETEIRKNSPRSSPVVHLSATIDLIIHESHGLIGLRDYAKTIG